MSRASRPMTVTLGGLQKHVEARVQSGAYASRSEAMRAPIRALDREEATLNDWLRKQVDESLADPRPGIPIRESFKRLCKCHERQMKTSRNAKI
jgi:antitoxin ParD1/3/4